MRDTNHTGEAAIRGEGSTRATLKVVHYCCRCCAITATFVHLALFIFLLLESMLHRHFANSPSLSTQSVAALARESNHRSRSQHFYHLGSALFPFFIILIFIAVDDSFYYLRTCVSFESDKNAKH